MENFKTNLAFSVTIVILAFRLIPVSMETFKPSTNVYSDVVLYSAIMVTSECSDTAFCNRTCPHRDDFPVYEDILTDKEQNCSDLAESELPPEVSTNTPSVHFNGTGACNDVNTSVTSDGQGFYSISFWLKTSCRSTISCPILQYGSLKLQLVGNSQLELSVPDAYNTSSTGKWLHIVLNYNGLLQWFVNGDVVYYELPWQDSGPDLHIGPATDLQGEDFISIADARYYSDVLTDREIKALLKRSQTLETLTSETNCRCPPNAPKYVAGSEAMCTNYNDTNREKRLNPSGGYVSYINDDDISTSWKSEPRIRYVDITLSLGDLFQIDGMIINGLDPVSVTMKIQLINQGEVTQELVFESANCGTTPNCHNISTITGQMFDLDDSSVSNRNDLSSLLADTINITISSNSDTQIAVGEIQLNVKCHCFGNDPSCQIMGNNYTCACSSNTAGTHCENCVQEFYREEGEFSCMKSCDCNLTGSNDSICDQVGGQCNCKSNINETSSRTCDECNFNTINLGSDMTAGCTSCSCNPTGIQYCATNRTCICKDNTETSTGNCADCLPNFYGLHLPTGCLPCDCNMTGTKDGRISQCNATTGQCDCKTNVEGRKCNRCKNGWYNLRAGSSTGCENQCGCHFVGSLRTDTCEISSGNCSCLENVQYNRNCKPEVYTIVPLFGPMAGGTVITVTGVLLGSPNTTDLAFTINDESQNITFWNSTMIIIETRPTNTVKSYSQSLIWNQDSNTHRPDEFSTETFQYKANPDLQTGQKFYTYQSGGCTMRVLGSNNMNSTFRPRVVIHMDSDDVFNECIPLSDTEISCPSPNILRYDFTGNASFGFIFDGYRMYETLDNQTAELMVLRDPVVNSYTSTFGNTFDTEIKIKGNFPMLESTCRENLKVLIGNKECDIKTIDRGNIVCDPKESFPGTTRDENLVIVFGYLRLTPGQIAFKDFWHTQEFLYIAIGVGCFLLIVIVTTTICCVQRRRKESNNQLNSMIGLVEKTTNEYSVSPGVVNPAMESMDTSPVDIKGKNTKDFVEEFMARIPTSLKETIKSSIVERTKITPGNICTRKGEKVRVIKGAFSSSAGIVEDNGLSIKTLISPYPAMGELPDWLQKGLEESSRMRDFVHENVLQCRGIAIDEKQVYILYPEMSNRTLKDYLTSASEPFTEEKHLDICVQVAEGMNFLHAHHIVHKDLAARNCWVDANHIVKISDASFTTDLYPEEYLHKDGLYLPVRWMAPESLNQLGFYHSKSDVWSYGVLMWEVFTNGYVPYYDITNSESISQLVCNQGYRLGKPHDCSDRAFSVIQLCHKEQSDHRPNFFLISNHLAEVISPQSEVSYVNEGELQDDLYENTTSHLPPLPPRK